MIPATHYDSFDLYIRTGSLKNMTETYIYIQVVCSFKSTSSYSSHLQISMRRSSAATTTTQASALSNHQYKGGRSEVRSP
jgi:hypothetical protein